jgi:Tfp pilus assembly PilM family ATPase
LEDPLLDAAADPAEWIEAHRHDLRQALGVMHGRSAAVCLATTSVRSLHVPEGSPEERIDMVRQELAADDEADETPREVDVWPVVGDSVVGGRGELVAAALPTATSDDVAEGLLRAGYHPRALDVAPYAMARAIRLCDPFCDEPTIGLKIDADSALLVLIRDGRPGFCRVLRGCGSRSITEPLVARLALTRQEAEQILLHHGIPFAANAGNSTAASISRLLSISLNKLVDEVRRTCDYLQQGGRVAAPERIWLFGDGAAVRNLPAFLADQCGIPTLGWTPSFPEPGETDDVRYGVAAGLSALPWEA